MVEMTEVANILRHATKRSLIILDEVGRGTSTFDGLSIAWAVAEYIHDAAPLGARTLFATHYHELTELAVTKEGVRNFNIAVREWGDRIIFLRKIMEGGTNRSYGIQVARIAGVPGEVIARAMEILRNLEQGELDEVGMPKIARGKKTTQKNANQLSLFTDQKETIMEELKALDLLNLTPLEAMARLDALEGEARQLRDNEFRRIVRSHAEASMKMRVSEPGYTFQAQSEEGDNLVVTLSGRVSLDDADRLLADMEAALDDRRVGSVKVDLADVSYMDSAGVLTLFRLEEKIRRKGRDFGYTRVPSRDPGDHGADQPGGSGKAAASVRKEARGDHRGGG